ncbi:MAG TPA: CopD family protein [Steroidobacteraceae bacterium]|nr:CopD family protein [Steroidobacteraceae bacterium]
MQIGGWDIAAVLAKAVTYAATLGAGGAVFFLLYCAALLRDSQRAAIRRLIAILVGISAAAGILRILLISGSMSGEMADMFNGTFARMILGAGEGRATGARLIGLALTLCALSSKRSLFGPGVAGAVMAVTSFAWIGHLHALVPNIAPSLLLCLHLLCASFWLGALTPLLIVTAGGNELQIAAAARLFGKLALRVVGLLVAAGASILLMLIHHAAQFWGSDYGAMMAAKLFAVACLLALAAWNKLHLTPRLLNRDARAAVLFRRSLCGEIALGSLILLATAALTTLAGPPPP